MKRAVFFDLDGTVLDTRPGIFRCVRDMLSSLKQGDRTDDEIMAIIGPPLTVGFSRILHTDDADRIQCAVSLYRTQYMSGGMYEAELFPGIVELCRDLSQEGVRLFVVTSKAESFAQKIVERFALDTLFSRVYGPDLDGNRSDKTELIEYVLESEKLVPEDAAMIGDREYDIIGARGNGVLAVGALWGFGTREELLGAGADHLVSMPSAVKSLVL